MSSLLPVSVNGTTFQAHGEYTSAKVAEDFQNSIAAFANIFNLGIDNAIDDVEVNTSNTSSQVRSKLEDDPNYATYLLNALLGGTVVKNYEVNPALDPSRPATTVTVAGLFNLLQNGMVVNDDPVLRPGTRYLSVEMASAVDELIRTLKMAGVNIQSVGGQLTVVGGITPTHLKNWRNLAATSDAIRRILQNAGDVSGNQNRTLQALVELVYVRTGNELLSDTMEGLEKALDVTKQSLESLNSLQALHNKITAKDLGDFPITIAQRSAAGISGAGSQTLSGILASGKIFFEGLDPTILDSLTNADYTEFMSLRRTLYEQIRALSGVQEGDSAGTLLEGLRKVLSDIERAFSAVGVATVVSIDRLTDTNRVRDAMILWILDSQMVRSANSALNIPGFDAGKIQRNLDGAISLGQALNDKQKDQVRQYLFVFEEYYKSAAAILNKITQILERMAQAISR